MRPAPEAKKECLREETIAAFVNGTLERDDLARAEAHLAACPDCRAVLADAAAGVSASRPSERQGLAMPVKLPEPGELVAGKYRIERFLGQGGMGAVLAAKHEELGSRVAIKILFRNKEEQAARFLREAQTCARLTSENVVRVFDLGRLPSGAPFLVMEYLTGEDLGEALKRGPLPIADAVSYVLQACAGLAEAHAAGVVHRDLKPQNLFLARRADGTAIVKVLDFGISKLKKSEADEPSLTTTQAVVGSPLYMSPEQIKDSKDVDERTDIWSLGVILYRLLTGKVPFPATSIVALSLAITTEAPAPPTQHRPEIPRALEMCVLRCLEKDRARRFANLAELSRALAPFTEAPAIVERIARIEGTRSPDKSPLATTGEGVAPVAQPVAAPRSRRTLVTVIGAAALVAGSVAATLVLTRTRAPAAPSAPPATSSAPPATSSAPPAASSSAPPAASSSAPPAASSVTPIQRHTAPPRRAPSASASAKPAPSRAPGPTDTPD